MQLIDDWKLVLQKAWSVKFNIAAALLGGIEAALVFVEPTGVPRGLFAGLAAFVSMSSLVARIMAQKEMSDAPAE